MDSKKNFINELYNRKIIYKISNEEKLKQYILENKKVKVYCGYDLTYESLHIGHLMSLTLLKRLYDYGNKIYILIGGSTSLIGDPSFQKKNRNKIKAEDVKLFEKKIINQIKSFSEINNFEIEFINNNDWYNNLNIIDFLYNIGDIFNIKKIINNKFIKNRLLTNNISFKEFSYILLQSYDFLKLYEKKNIMLQIGGSDQFSNINFGIKIIKKIYKKNVFGITFPLIEDNNGFKISKSNNNNTIWLDKTKTTKYEIYQYVLNIKDNKIFDLLKSITFIKLDEIKYLENSNNTENIINGKKLLANSLINIIFGKNYTINYTKNNYQTNNIYNLLSKIKKKEDLKLEYFNKLYNLNKLNSFCINYNDNITLINILIKIKDIKTKSDAKRLIISKSIKINNQQVIDIKYTLNIKDIMYNKYTLITKGKRKYYIILWKHI